MFEEAFHAFCADTGHQEQNAEVAVARSPQQRDLVSLLSICGLSPIIRNGLACNIFWLQATFFVRQLSIHHLLQTENKKEVQIKREELVLTVVELSQAGFVEIKFSLLGSCDSTVHFLPAGASVCWLNCKLKG